jgi:hypothetical protein
MEYCDYVLGDSNETLARATGDTSTENRCDLKLRIMLNGCNTESIVNIYSNVRVTSVWLG